MNGKILITGGAGFIGSHLCDELTEKRYDVRILDNLSEQVHGAWAAIPRYTNPKAEFSVGDIRDPVAVKDALKDVDAVFHFAAKVDVGQSMYEIEKYTEVKNMKYNDRNEQKAETGILEWFRPGEYEEVEQAIQDMKNIGIHKLRTGIPWADWFRDGSAEWYDWMWKKLSKEVEVLPCFLYTPPSLGEIPRTSSPPRNLKAYADFIDVMITRYGDYFEWAELWNEPNNTLEYDFTRDYSWFKFSQMIRMASYWAHQRGKKTLLGGMSPIDPNWLHTGISLRKKF